MCLHIYNRWDFVDANVSAAIILNVKKVRFVPSKARRASGASPERFVRGKGVPRHDYYF